MHSFTSVYLITDNPLKLNVTLNGELKITLPSVAGIYIRQSNGEHDFLHWLQDPGTNAIWYYKKFGYWLIGLQDYIGSTNSLLYTSENVTGPQIATIWKYDNATKVESDDILVDAIVEPGTFCSDAYIIEL